MANKKEPVPGTRGARIREIQERLGLDQEAFAELLQETADGLQVDGPRWTASLVSQKVLGGRAITLDDAAVLMRVTQQRGLRASGMDWDWFVYSEAQAPGSLQRAIGAVTSSVPALPITPMPEQSPAKGRKAAGGTTRGRTPRDPRHGHS